MRRLALACFTLFLFTLFSLPAVPGEGDRPTAAAKVPLAGHELAWLTEVELLITPAERSAFLALTQPYQRERFIESFWRQRDPYPTTEVNEFRNDWRERLELAAARYGGANSDRGQAVLLGGQPHFIHQGLCPEVLAPNEIWVYRTGMARDRVLVFVRAPGGADPYRLWRPREGLGLLGAWRGALISIDSEARRELERGCGRSRQVLELLASAVDLAELARELDRLPKPSDEWVTTFLNRSTDLAADVERFEADVRIEFPGRYQSRTVVQGLILLPEDQVSRAEHPLFPSYNFMVNGEVLRGDQLFENFRYRFDVPAEGLAEEGIPLLVRRHLRPGRYRLILRVEDLNGGRFFRREMDLEVPKPPSAPSRASIAARTVEPEEHHPTAHHATTAEHVLKILPLPDELQIGRQRVHTSTSGEGIAKVAFFLNGNEVMRKKTAPFSLELDFGEAPRTHLLEAVAYDAEGAELARDRIPVNSGPHRFGVRLLEPRPGGRYTDSLEAFAEVDLPLGEKLDSVELYLNETLLATLYQPPFVQPIRIPRGEEITYVRAVATLEDGNSAEDLVVINGPENLDHLDVNFVELYTTVLDRKGNNVKDLAREEFSVLEDDIPQRIRRFDWVFGLPIHAALVLDTSTSMESNIKQVEKTALEFFRNVIQPKDRAAVIVFSDFPELKVGLTNNHEVLAGALAAIEADGETALYDSVVFGLYYLAGLRGKRALIVVTDGEDSASKHSFEETLEFARRSGAAIYTIGVDLDRRDHRSKSVLRRLAAETGGTSFFIAAAQGLERVYEKLEAELRSQYLIAYQSAANDNQGFRQVEVRLDRSDLNVKTIPGYYP